MTEPTRNPTEGLTEYSQTGTFSSLISSRGPSQRTPVLFDFHAIHFLTVSQEIRRAISSLLATCRRWAPVYFQQTYSFLISALTDMEGEQVDGEGCTSMVLTGSHTGVGDTNLGVRSSVFPFDWTLILYTAQRS